MSVIACPVITPLPLANIHLFRLSLGLALNLLQFEDQPNWRSSSNAFKNGTGASLDESLISSEIKICIPAAIAFFQWPFLALTCRLTKQLAGLTWLILGVN